MNNPVMIEFGIGLFERLPQYVHNRRALLITSEGRVSRGKVKLLESEIPNLRVCTHSVPNPSTELFESIVNLCRSQNIEIIIGLGGGSCLDVAKVVAVLIACSPGTTMSLLMKHGPERGLPWIAVPTTAGSGSEVTPFAAIWDGAIKKSIDHPLLFANMVLWDPTLTVSLPRTNTLSTGLDALSQCFESLWNVHRTEETSVLALEGIRRTIQYLPQVLLDGARLDFRSEMARASLSSGLAISHTRTALSHAISYPLTGYLDLPHGYACSFALPEILVFYADSPRGKELEADCRKLGFSGVEHCALSLSRFLSECGANEIVANTVKSQFQLKSYISEMSGPRSKNGFRIPASSDIDNILTKAWRRLTGGNTSVQEYSAVNS